MKTPTINSTIAAVCQPKTIAWPWFIPYRVMPSFSAGNSTSAATANVLGVSSPSGMAVTSQRPVRRARRIAIHV